MIFMHTIDKVISKEKTQTSRIWKDAYLPEYFEDELIAIRRPNGNLLYYIGQEVSVQPARGQKGIARIRIQELHKADVRTFDTGDIARESFRSMEDFLGVWVSMHDKPLYKWCYQYPKTPMDLIYHASFKSEQFYTALVIIFELVTEKAIA